ncbi:hypothetical protein BYT27DRAFT_6930995 [Phlegmacium glaucopus]|nr:hypothetical protein BYT27DRAFT_6930995 [Phlegmacium glaucopus]
MLHRLQHLISIGIFVHTGSNIIIMGTTAGHHYMIPSEATLQNVPTPNIHHAA